MNEIILQNNNGQILASSRDVAEKFGKEHDKVCRDIKKLLKSQPTKLASEFIESEYLTDRGRTYTEYLLTRDGFSLLCMGFTGDKALEWKLKYIEAFNKMEEKIKSSNLLSEEEKLKLMLFSKDAGEVAYAHNRLIELATAPLIEENKHKQEVINGFTDDVDIYKKRVIINRICKRRHGNYANRYKELYKCFRETFHIDLEARCEGYNLKQIKKKDHLTVIGYAENFGFIDDLYSCCVKLYETEVNEILEELRNVQK